MSMENALPKAKKTLYTVVMKRVLDVLLSLLAIIILSPLLIIVAILGLILQGWPILFSQERLGLHGKIFKIYKFRSMNNKKNVNGELLPGEQRLTTFGKIIRKFSIDELPELFCILNGKMSIIGPRPLLVKYLPLYSKRHMQRHEVKPGLACYSLKSMEAWTWNDQFENDIWYVENCSFWIDLRMIYTVAKQALHGSKTRYSDLREEFNGKNLYSGSNL